MNHIDEGTIHAWIDGALSAERAREVEAHVAQCAACSAAVAEARGLVAGASRILMALDDVPANVTPKRSLPAPSPAPFKRQRQWRAAPWVTGIAAALVLAIGITTWNRDSARMMRSEAIAPALGTDSVAPTQTTQSLSDRASAEAARSSPGGTASGGRGANATPQVQVGEAPPAVAGPVASKRAGAQQRTRGAREETSTPIRTLAGAPAPPSAIAEGKAPGVVDTAAPRRSVTATGAAGGFAASADTTRLRSVMPSPDTARRRRFGEEAMRLESVVVTSVGANVTRDSADVRLVAGCYQLVLPAERGVAKLTERVAAAAAPSSDASRRAAPVPALTRADVAESRAPSRVRLDTTQNRAGFMVRDETTNAYLGTWQRIKDSLRVILPGQGTFMVAAKDRVSCPER